MEGASTVRPLTASVPALSAPGHKLVATSNNPANLNVNEVKKMPGCHAGGDPKGVRVDIRQVNTPGAPTPNALTNIGLPVEMSEINLIEEIPEPMTASRGYAPNLKTLESGDEMMGPLLDMTG